MIALNESSTFNRKVAGFWAPGVSGFAGQTLFDLSRRTAHGTLNGPSWSGRRFHHGASLSFDGSNDYVDSMHTHLSSTGNFGVCFAARPADVTTGQYITDGATHSALNNKRACIVGFQSGNYNIFQDSGSGGFYPTGTAADSQMAASGNNVWDVVLWTSDGTNVQGYVNGKQKVDVTASSWGAVEVHNYGLGRPYGTASNHFNGNVGALIYWDRHIKPSEPWHIYREFVQGFPTMWSRVSAEGAGPAPAGGGGGLSIPIAAYHYNHHLGTMA